MIGRFWTPLHARLHQLLKQRHLLEQSQRVLVAVSGGQDSLCLFKLLLDLQPKWNWYLAVGHCDHHWRADSTANADYVELITASWKLPFYRRTAQQIPKTEAEARQWRYQQLADIAQQEQFHRVVTGHTASDRAETLLYNLIRGSGTDGLQALAWQRPLVADVQLVRPLLSITRSETAKFCQEMNLPVWEDHTNQDLHYRRNRIRQELLPYLQTHFNPQAEQALAQTAELLLADVTYLEAIASQLLQEALMTDKQQVDRPERPKTCRINRRILQPLPLALQRRVIRQFLQQQLPCSPTFADVEKMAALITATNRSQTDPFPGGAIAKVEGDWLYLTQQF